MSTASLPSVAELAAGIRAGNRAMLARAITLVESNRADHIDQAQELLLALTPYTGGAMRVGITGVPGAGKSTFIESLGVSLVDQGHRVAVLAVDPSSPMSHGSILGDKTRMNRLAQREEAFIRPSPTGGSLGGVGRKTRETILLCEAAGFGVVLVETVGVGQSETLVASMVDFFAVLLLPGGGDELQGIKRGIVELADLIAINKADGDNVRRAELARREYAAALHYIRRDDSWTVPVLTCSALSGDGVGEVWAEVLRHRALQLETGGHGHRRHEQLRSWMWSMVDASVLTRVRTHAAVAGRAADVEREVVSGLRTASQGAAELLRLFWGDKGV